MIRFIPCKEFAFFSLNLQENKIFFFKKNVSTDISNFYSEKLLKKNEELDCIFISKIFFCITSVFLLSFFFNFILFLNFT